MKVPVNIKNKSTLYFHFPWQRSQVENAACTDRKRKIWEATHSALSVSWGGGAGTLRPCLVEDSFPLCCFSFSPNLQMGQDNTGTFPVALLKQNNGSGVRIFINIKFSYNSAHMLGARLKVGNLITQCTSLHASALLQVVCVMSSSTASHYLWKAGAQSLASF